DVGLFGSTAPSSVIRNVGLVGGSVIGLSSAGGLVGSNTGTISNSYNTGTVNGESNLGGLMGSNTGPVTSSYWNKETSGQASSPAGTGMTSAQMQQLGNFTSSDFANIWIGYNGLTNPLLRSFMSAVTVTAALQKIVGIGH
ncbi:MAG: GLUG motif-containing protein, partial [Planctomycetota bacterium]